MKKASSLCVLTALAGMILQSPAGANPVFVQAESGDIRIEESGPVYGIYASDRAIGSFESFSNQAWETINSIQASPDHTALYRVIGAEPSTIFGALNANSRIFLVNPNGILFAPGSSVNAPGLVASALNLSNDDFLAGRYLFTAGEGAGRVVNQGNLDASHYVVLLGKSVANEGTVRADGGAVALASGASARLLLDSEGLVSIDATAPLEEAVFGLDGARVADAVANSGLLSAEGGRVLLTASQAGAVFDHVINHSGVIEAASAGVENGTVVLYGGNEGIVKVTGSIDASGRESGETGGTVHVLGEKVGLFGHASVDASGHSGGGTVLVGGDEQGLNPEIPNATAVYFSPDASVRADAIASGDGGKVILFAEESAKIYGHLSAHGGAVSGDGGFVETSGKESFEILRTPDITAPNGSGGRWLIDPRNITIGTGGGNAGINGSDPFVSFSDSSSLGVNLILAALTGGATVDVITGASGTESGDITLNAAIDYNGKGTNTLIFKAHGTIFINQSIADSNTSSGSDKLHVQLLAGTGIDFNAQVATNGGDLIARTTTGDIDITAQNQVISAICGSCQNGFIELAAYNGNITVADTSSGLTEIHGSSELTLIAKGVGSIPGPLGLFNVFNLTIIDVNGTGNMYIDELGANSTASIDISVPTATAGDININFFDTDIVTILTGHQISNVDLSASDRSFSYIANTGNILVLSLTVDTPSQDTLIFANGGDITFGNASTVITGFLNLSASGAINGSGGTAANGDGIAEIILNGGLSASAKQIGNSNELEVHVINGAGNETGEFVSSATSSGFDINVELLNNSFDEIAVSVFSTLPNIDITMPSVDLIDIDGGASAITLTNVSMLGAQPDFYFELTGTGDIAVQTVNIGTGELEIDAFFGNLLDSGSAITAGDVTFYASGNVGTAGNPLTVNAAGIIAVAGGQIGLVSTIAMANLDFLYAGSSISVTSGNGFDIGLLYTGGSGAITLFTSAGDMFDLNGGGLNFDTGTLTLTASAGSVGTSGDPLEATFDSLTASSPNFITFIKPGDGSKDVGGLTLLNGRLTGGDNIQDLTTSLFGEQKSEGREESDKKEEEAAPVNPDAASGDQTKIEEPAPSEEDAPPVDSETFSPCGI